MSTSQNIYAIKDRAPEFPCWCRRMKELRKGGECESWSFWATCPEGFDQNGFTHWSPDAAEAPKATPSRPASPELPESVRQEVEEFLITDFGYLRGGVATYMKADKLLKKLTPLWPSADRKGKTLEEFCGMPPGSFAEYLKKQNAAGGPEAYAMSATPSPLAGLPTPETDAAKCRMNICMTSVELDAVSADFARSLERRLAAAESRINELTKLNA